MKKQKAQARKRKSNNQDPLERDMSFVFDDPTKWKQFSELFQFAPKDKTITLRMSADLLNRYKELADKMDTKYQKLIREALLEYLLKKAS
jgi:predicted DNA binding CopG/RHH family protein